MKMDFSCDVCNHNSWKKHTVYTFDDSNLFNNKKPDYPRREYLSLRQHILYHLWFPDQKVVQLTSLCCNNCGFMCYSPRPTDHDLNIKYQYLSTKEQIGAINNPTTRSLQLNDKRTLRIYNIAKRFNNKKSLNVLDYGGGDGRLLKYFIKNNHDSYLVDFNENPLPGVKRIGSVLDDIPKDMRFDVIICSHVLEHVADPIGLLKGLRSMLNEGGIVYVEVPLEIYQGIPINYDPVTHINFFTVESLKAAALFSNYKVKTIRFGFEPYEEKYKRVAWTVIANSDHKNGSSFSLNPKKTFRLLNPDLTVKAQRFLSTFWLRRVLNNPKTFNRLEKLKSALAFR